MRKIKKNDDVLVITGDDKGRQGKVLRVFSNSKVLVEGINLVKKHQKPNPQRGIQGGIIEKEMPIHVSNVALLNPVTAKADRVGFKEVKGEKVRYFKSNDEIVDI
jgi:large subunit ribosomal protein L24